MTKQARFWLGTALALGLAAPALAQDITADTVVATVNGAEITLGHMQVLRNQLPAQYQELPDETLFEGILEQLIQQTALAQAIETNLTRRDLLALENERRAFLAGTTLDNAALAAASDAAVQAAYDAQFTNAEPAREFNAAHILVETEAEAQTLKDALDGGADFAELAREHTKDPSGVSNGGALGWFGAGMMVQPFEDAVLVLEPGQVSGPVQTQFGWHIVKLNEVRLAETPTLEDVRPEIEAHLQQTAIEAKLKELTEAAEITRNVEGIDPAVLKDQTLLDK